MILPPASVAEATPGSTARKELSTTSPPKKPGQTQFPRSRAVLFGRSAWRFWPQGPTRLGLQRIDPTRFTGERARPSRARHGCIVVAMPTNCNFRGISDGSIVSVPVSPATVHPRIRTVATRQSRPGPYTAHIGVPIRVCRFPYVRQAPETRGYSAPGGEVCRTGGISGGESGIRTHETVPRLHTFQACAFDHSATSPLEAADYTHPGVNGKIGTALERG
jgi:hypothetical protein